MPDTNLRTQDGRLVGTLKGNVLFKEVKASRHKFRAIGPHGAWGIDYDVLVNKLPSRAKVQITDSESGTVYMVSAERWQDCGEILHFKKGTKDEYVQVFLPLEYFDKAKPEQTHGI